ncbi:MAG: DUF2442 domain-containing protein [Gemmatimonadales bacterium]|jgi:hypothetical protein
MLYRIVQVEARPDYRVWIRFEDGTEGEVDLSDLVGKGVFERWNDPGEFERVYIDEGTGTLAWPGGLDVAPDRLYRDLKPVSAPRVREP